MRTIGKVVFTPSGRRGSFPLGTPVLEAARELGVDIASICGGRGLCGRCQVLCSEGDFPKHGIVSRQEHLSPFTATERSYGDRRKPLAPGRRLSCQATVQGNLVIDVPPESQIHRQVVRKAADHRAIRLDPVVRLYLVDVEEARLDDSFAGGGAPSGSPAETSPAGDGPSRSPAESFLAGDGPSRSPAESFPAGDGPSRSPAESFLARGAPSRSPAESFLARGAPSRSPAESFLARGAPSRSPAEGSFLRGASPSRSPAEGSQSDLTRLKEALRTQWDLGGLNCGTGVLAGLQAALREGNWSVTVAVHRDREIIGVWPGYRGEVYGLAIDVGSTTIAAHLCELSSGSVICSDGRMNPQIRFGEDLMSRVSYVMMHPEGSREMTVAVREAINELVARTSAAAGITPDDVLSIAFVCNPIMHHLLLGLSPVELGGAPFALAVDTSVYATARELGIEINPGGVAYVLPCIAGHVGADTAGVILSEQPHDRDEINLIVDIGTNAEIVLGNRHRLLACSSPTGPAFEGAQVSCGQRAAPGAIERVRIDPHTLATRIRVIGSELWSDDPGFADALPGGVVTGICGSGIIEAVVEMYLAGVLSGDGVIDGTLAGGANRIIRDGRTFSFILYRGDSTISVTQNDVRQIQLAKAALYAGVKLLMDRLEIDTLDRVRLAGAFGSHIDVTYAMALGLIPDCPVAQAGPAGNAAGTGARIALLNKASRDEIEAVVKRIERVETAVEPKFQEYFVNAMAIPHASDPFPNLSSVFAMPKRRAAASVGQTTRRRHRRQGQRI